MDRTMDKPCPARIPPRGMIANVPGAMTALGSASTAATAPESLMKGAGPPATVRAGVVPPTYVPLYT